jgi:hypothetical protein
MQNMRRFVGRRNYPLRRTRLLVGGLYATVQGDDDSIADLSRTQFQAFPEVEAIRRQEADPALGDAALEIRLRPPVPFEHARIVVEQTAEEAGVVLSTLTYSHLER